MGHTLLALRLIASASLAVSAASAAPPSASAGTARKEAAPAAAPAVAPLALPASAEVLGVRLGMTPARALTALKKSAPRYQLQTPYTTSLAEIQRQPEAAARTAKDRYLPELIGTLTTRDTSYLLRVRFGRPPQPNVVLDVEWSAAGPQGNQSLAAHLSSTIARRGKPLAQTASAISPKAESGTGLAWVYGGADHDCTLRGVGWMAWPKAATDLKIRLEDCAPALTHNIVHWQNTLRRTTTRLSSIGQLLLNQDEHRAYLAQLESSAGPHPADTFGPRRRPPAAPGPCKLEQVDWKNFTYPYCDECAFAGGRTHYELKDGEGEVYDEGDAEEPSGTAFTLGAIHYQDRNRNGRVEAYVELQGGGVGHAVPSDVAIYAFEYNSKCELQYLGVSKQQ